METQHSPENHLSTEIRYLETRTPKKKEKKRNQKKKKKKKKNEQRQINQT